MKKSGSVRKWIWWFSLIAAAILLYKAADNLAGFTAGIGSFINIFTPFIIGFVITFLLYAPCNQLEGLIKKSKSKLIRRAARGVSIGACYLVFLAVIVGILVLLLPALYNGIASFVKNLPTYYADISARLEEYTAEGGLIERLGLTDTLHTAYQTVYQMLLSLANPDTLLTAFKGILSFTSSLFDVIMALIVSVYMLAQREALLRAAKSLLGAVLNDRVMATCTLYVYKTASIFYSYLYGALMDAVVVAVVMAIGLSLFGLPQSVLLGCMIGLMNFIPYFGAIIGGCIAVIVALFTKNIYTAIGVLIYIVAMQQIDANIIQPKIISTAVGIRPIYVLLAITLGGGLFGFWGMLISVPVMAVIKMLLSDFIAYRKRVKETAQPQASEE